MPDSNGLDITIYTGPNNIEKLKETIDLCRAKADFAILESLTKTDFFDPKAKEIDPLVYPKGRIFNESFELRWEKMDAGDGYRTTLASEPGSAGREDDVAEYFNKDETVEKEYSNGFCDEPDNHAIYLRPENDPTLGRTLRYDCIKARPAMDNPNALLEIKRYHDAHGRLIFWRYRKMRWDS